MYIKNNIDYGYCKNFGFILKRPSDGKWESADELIEDFLRGHGPEYLEAIIDAEHFDWNDPEY